jgi:hypothetical protein
VGFNPPYEVTHKTSMARTYPDQLEIIPFYTRDRRRSLSFLARVSRSFFRPLRSRQENSSGSIDEIEAAD